MPEKLERPQYLLEMFLFLATLKFGHYGVATFGLWSYLLHPLLLVKRDSSQAQMLRRLAARLSRALIRIRTRVLSSSCCDTFRFPVDHRQNKRGRIFVIVIDGVGGFHPAGAVFGFFLSVQISIEARKVAAGDLQTDAMSCEKNVAGCPGIDL